MGYRLEPTLPILAYRDKFLEYEELGLEARWLTEERAKYCHEEELEAGTRKL